MSRHYAALPTIRRLWRPTARFDAGLVYVDPIQSWDFPFPPSEMAARGSRGIFRECALPIHPSPSRNRPCISAEREDDRAHLNILGARRFGLQKMGCTLLQLLIFLEHQAS
jgi:hypothetical protein